MTLVGLTDIGVRYPNNQDTYWSAKLKVNGIDVTVLAVCDGMGGLEDGALASRLTITHIRDAILDGGIDREVIMSGILKANTELLELEKSSEKRRGTTCSIVVLSRGFYYGYHIGDTRVYQMRDSRYKILTEDHTALNAKRKKGEEITPEIERRYRSTLTRCIGVNPRPRIDFFSGDYVSGDTFVVCSDGFWHYWDGSLADIEGSIEKVKSLGERDNITVTYWEVV